jgi:hypothetical protein
MSDEDRDEHAARGIDAGAAAVGAGTGLLLGGPLGALIGAATPEAVKAAVAWLRTEYSARQEGKLAFVLSRAADESALSLGELLIRLDANPEKQEIFVRTIRTAQGSAKLVNLIALSRSLAELSLTDDAVRIQSEGAFVRAIDQLDSTHVQLLQIFEQTSDESGIVQGHGHDQVPPAIYPEQLAEALPQLASLVPLLAAGLQAHGLILARADSSGMLQGGSTRLIWEITDLGRDFLERMASLDAVLRTGRK